MEKEKVIEKKFKKDNGLNIDELVKQIKKFGAKGYFINDLSDFYCGEVKRTGITKRYKRDMYIVGLGFSAKEVLREKCKGIPMKRKDFKLMPLLLWINLSDKQIKEWEKEKTPKK